MKNINFFTIFVVAFIGHAYAVDSNSSFLESLEPTLIEIESPFNLLYSAASATANDTITQYKEIFKNVKDECLRSCYSYGIHSLEIYHNQNCDHEFTSINNEYKKNKPCFIVSPNMQRVLDYNNAYVDLYCAKDENKQACPFVKNIIDIQRNTTQLESSCETPGDKRTQCDTSLINNLSIMSDVSSKLVNKTVTYVSDGRTFTLPLPKYNLTLIESAMVNKTCLVNIESPKEVLMKVNPKGNSDKNSSATTQTINLLIIMLSFVFTTLFF